MLQTVPAREIPFERSSSVPQIGSPLIRKRILGRNKSYTIPLLLENIVYFYSSNGVSFAVDNNNEKYIMDQSLTELESILDERSFFRINRQHLIHLTYIAGFRTYERIRIELKLSVTFILNPMLVSQESSSAFRKWIASV